MIKIAGDKWIADLGRMRYCNFIDDITLDFEEVDGKIYSEFWGLPVNIIMAGHLSPDEDQFFDIIREEGEKVFLKAYRASKKNKKDTPNQWR